MICVLSMAASLLQWKNCSGYRDHMHPKGENTYHLTFLQSKSVEFGPGEEHSKDKEGLIQGFKTGTYLEVHVTA